jgi:hypothetical protein
VLDIASGDGVLAELLAPHAIATSASTPAQRVVAAAAERLRRYPNVEVREGDMHALPFKDASFDLVVLMHALTYAGQARTGRGRERARAAQGWSHAAVQPGPPRAPQRGRAYGHVKPGLHEKELRKFAEKAGLRIASCETVTRERARRISK